MRIAFVHPDLGIGGSERLIVDAALAMQKRGHQVHIFTSHHDPRHCFPETNSRLQITIQGDFIPRHIAGYFHLLLAGLRALYLALWIYFCFPSDFDVIVADQISFTIPILKKCASAVAFYCHFPDKLLAPKSRGWLRNILYRRILDTLEDHTIVKADKLLVNSKYTQGIVQGAFPNLKEEPLVLYPPVDTDKFTPINSEEVLEGEGARIVLLSINRFERKKNIGLAIKALSHLRNTLSPVIFERIQLILAGGYDIRVAENRHYLTELEIMAEQNDLEYKTLPIGAGLEDMNDFEDLLREGTEAKVVFMPSISDATKLQLLSSAFVVLYTSANEHFGIVPLEAMAMGVPVIALNSGGPRETVIDSRTGFLCEEDPEAVARAVKSVVEGKFYRREDLAREARRHVVENFNFERFGNMLEYLLEQVIS